MNGIDISSYQAGIDLSVVPCDFVIIKATQGVTYTNGDLRRAYNQARQNDKLIGLYHYASSGGAEAEAKHFLKAVEELGAVGKAIFVLDWEVGDNKNWGNLTYAKIWLEYVQKQTGVTPFIYMSKIQGCRSFDWKGIAGRYPLWVAQYANYRQTGYQSDPWTDAGGYGAWVAPMIFQYTSSGRLKGWNSNLDLNIAYMAEHEWKAWATPEGQDAPASIPKTFSGMVTASALRVRTKPDAASALVQVGGHDFLLPNGLCVAFDAQYGTWGRLAGCGGWVSLQYIQQ